jgi:hypothetical protein
LYEKVLAADILVLVTGNEDGVKHCAMNILYSLQHAGYTIPPQADAGPRPRQKSLSHP